jgi:plastocyanin
MTAEPHRLDRACHARQTRRRTLQTLAAASGSLLLARALALTAAPLAFAQDDDDSDHDDNSGRGRGRGRGGDDHDNSGPGNAGDREGSPATVEVPPGSIAIRIVSDDADGFVPGALTIDAGQSITFVNQTNDEHTATGAGFDTGIIPPGAAATVTLDSPGTYPYGCQIHPEMTGTVEVRGGSGDVPAPAAPVPPSNTHDVTIANLAFEPGTIMVPVGTTVTWTNDDTVPHTVTSIDGVFDSGIFEPGATFSWTFDLPGTYRYRCLIHPQMHGVVTVQEAAAPGATPVAGVAPASEAESAAGIWIVQLTPDDNAVLGAHQALFTLHPDMLAEADFAASPGATAPVSVLTSGRGEWAATGEEIELALVVLMEDENQRFAGTVTIGATGRIAAEGDLDGTFQFAVSSAGGETLGEGSGALHGERFTFPVPAPTPVAASPAAG